MLVVGFDNIAAMQQLLREGKVVATADQHGDQLAVFGIEYALEMLKAKVLPPTAKHRWILSRWKTGGTNEQ